MLRGSRFRLHPISRAALVAAALSLFSAQAFAQQRLVIIGGGSWPPAAVSRFMEWAGGARAHVLIISWATEDPQGAFASESKEFAAFHPASVEAAPFVPLDEAAKTKFLGQLANATGVFFSGGDQVRVMNVLKDERLLQALRQKYHQGVVFGGTSAGTAIMSRRMITGEGDFTVIDAAKVETREGLGLLPPDVIVDQHFIKRQRENRLFGLILQEPSALGVGIDEATALLVTDNRHGEVVGASRVMLIDGRAHKGALVIRLLRAGEGVDLLKRMPEALRRPSK